MYPPRLIALALLTAAALPAAAQIRVLPAPDTTAGNYFGAALALEGGRALVGASGEAGCGPNSGMAYVYERAEGGGFEAVARLAPATCEAGRFFGRAVALSGERALVAAGGETTAIGRPNTAHLFERDARGVWREVATLAGEPGAAEGAFASSVALEGDRALVTAAGDPAGRAFTGAAYVFERGADGRWRQAARLAGPRDHPGFGTMGVLSGDRLAVTASPHDDRGAGSVHIYDRQPDGTWAQTGRIDRVEAHTVRASLAGSLLLVGHPRAGPNRSGEAVLYGRTDAGRWVRVATLRADVPYRDGAFGTAVALRAGEGRPRALVAGYTEQLGFETNVDRVVHVFSYSGEAGWVHRQVLDVGTWAFGAALALDGRTAIVGRTSDAEPGRVYAAELFE
jgi:hypothetical protein